MPTFAVLTGRRARVGMLTAALLCLIAAAPAAGTECYAFYGYGQSTMDAPACTITYFEGYIAGTTLTVTKCIGGSGPLAVGVPIAAHGIANVPTTVIAAFGTGTGREGAYTVNNAQMLGTVDKPILFSALIATDDFVALTPANVTRNAYMIADPLGGPRPMWESLAPDTPDSEAPVSPARWHGFSPLHELAYAGNVGRGGFFIETPLSGFAAQFAAEMGKAPDRYAMVLAGLSRGGADWATSTLQLKPGTAHWTNLLTAARYVKQGVEQPGNALVNHPGPATYRTGGMILRLGETAAAGGRTGTKDAFTTASTTLAMAGPNPYGSVNPGWQVYDATARAWVGTVKSWTGAELALNAPAATASAGANDMLLFSVGNDGFLAELRELLAQWNAADIATPRSGAPVFAAQPSSSNFTIIQAAYGFHIALAHVRAALADRRFVLAGPSFVGRYQSDCVHQQADGNAIVGAYLGQWAAWWHQGKRTTPFIMTASAVLPPAQCDGTHYGVRVTFAMPPTGSAAQQTLQLYTDKNIPAVANGGFCYTDGPMVFDYHAPAASGIMIAATPFLARANTRAPGAANQIDIPLSGDPAGARNPTISLGAGITPNGVTILGVPNAHLFVHNVADSSTRAVALPGLAGKAFGPDGNRLVNFASACAIQVGQTLAPAW